MDLTNPMGRFFLVASIILALTIFSAIVEALVDRANAAEAAKYESEEESDATK